MIENSKTNVYLNKENQRDYDEILIDGENKMSGSRNKKFQMVSSDMFSDLINEIRNNPNCSYRTYINDLIKSGYTPKYISVLKKNSSFINYLREAISSRILNYFGVPTSYEQLAIENDETRVLSVDYIESGYNFYSMRDLELVFSAKDPKTTFEQVDIVLGVLQRYDKNMIANIDEEIYDGALNKFKQDLMLSFLVRGVLLNDADFQRDNIGINLNKENGDFQLVNFDYECSFIQRTPVSTAVYRILEYAKSNYPQVYKNFKEKLLSFTKVDSNGQTQANKIILNLFEETGDNSEKGRRMVKGIEELVIYNADLILSIDKTKISNPER